MFLRFVFFFFFEEKHSLGDGAGWIGEQGGSSSWSAGYDGENGRQCWIVHSLGLNGVGFLTSFTNRWCVGGSFQYSLLKYPTCCVVSLVCPVCHDFIRLDVWTCVTCLNSELCVVFM